MNYFESKMQEPFFRWILNIFLAIIIFYLAKLSSLLGLQGSPLPFSPVWPATGFALAAVLLFGYNACIGIFAGNFFYNFLNLYSSKTTLELPLFTAFTITSGSVLEAVFVAFVMKHFSHNYYLTTVKDIFVFLIAALLGSLLAATIGTSAIYLFDNISWLLTVKLWAAFLVGDLMGVYIFTPLLVIWATSRLKTPAKLNIYEIGAIIVAFFIICYLSIFLSYPIVHFYILISIWAAYRFRLHGATLSILIISLATIIPTSFGVGTFMTMISSESSLIILVNLLEIVVAVSLLLATLLNEREAIISLLELQNVDLRQSIDLHIEAIKEMAREILIKQKQSSLGLLASKIANYLPRPLAEIKTLANACLNSLHQLQNLLPKNNNIASNLPELCNNMERSLKALCSQNEKADFIANAIQKQINFLIQKKSKAKRMHINTLLNISLNNAIQEAIRQTPDFTYTLTKDLDKGINTYIILPEDLIDLFTQLFSQSFKAMRKKKDEHGENYRAELCVQSTNREEMIEIIFEYNSLENNEDCPRDFFQTFMQVEERPIGAIRNLELSLAHDILTLIYHGSMKAETKEGAWTEFKILLPKEGFGLTNGFEES